MNDPRTANFYLKLLTVFVCAHISWRFQRASIFHRKSLLNPMWQHLKCHLSVSVSALTHETSKKNTFRSDHSQCEWFTSRIFWFCFDYDGERIFFGVCVCVCECVIVFIATRQRWTHSALPCEKLLSLCHSTLLFWFSAFDMLFRIKIKK